MTQPRATRTIRRHLMENLELIPAQEQEIVKRPNMLFQPIRHEDGRTDRVVHKFTIRDLNNARIVQLHEIAHAPAAAIGFVPV